MSEKRIIKRVDFVGSAREDLKGFPDEAKQDLGYALYEAQKGEKPVAAKPLKGFSGAGVLEIVENFSSGTYRAVYTVRFQKVIYVLHCFQKKSKHGIKTPQQDIDLIKQRLRAAEEDYNTNYK
ncbi:MAG: type II toxin-antitoxin system RelE/ParE family toxin [Candidatus Omnitrophota bacterium]